MLKPKILDLFCGAGGAAMGYYRAGFDVVGVDISPQPHYPFPFIQGEAVDILVRMLGGEKFLASDGVWYGIDDFSAIHASPPCQGYSRATIQWRKRGNVYPDLIEKTREVLKATGLPYVIENVPGAPLINPTELNGAKFGMLVRRRRLFETSFPVPLVLNPPCVKSCFRMGRNVREGIDEITPVGHFSNVAYAKKQMGIDWMTREELAQAIPPAYTELIGAHLLAFLQSRRKL